MKFVLIGLVYLYQITPINTHSLCNFTPRCSDYMIEALYNYGAIKGLTLGIKRILRCHPHGKCGYDPVPKKREISK